MSLFNRRKKPIIVTIHGFGRNLSHEFDPLARYLKARKYEVIQFVPTTKIGFKDVKLN